ncbi:hypothetical protein LTR86_005428 [Recurvomyces mirabilis]|nr:hypothetical protein LTR86_005428 [Recurvomyces mirabilis]
MPLLKLKTGGAGQASSQPSTGVPQSATSAGPSATSPAPSTASTIGRPKLKLKASQPPTPATEHPPSTLPTASRKNAVAGLASKKRGANDDISPATKRIASGQQAVRKPSLKIKAPAAKPPYADLSATTPYSAGSVNKLKLSGPKRKSTARIKALTTHNVKREVQKRETGVGEREEDPAIQQGLVLRMQPGEDADLLRNAIANGKVGLSEEGGVGVSIKFVTPDLRRAVVKVKGRMYAAALVDLPCIVESMKSWDKKGWWKVADICQMLLVLGPVRSEAEIRDFPLPREVNKETMQYAHGLTPPMHHVRRRRFRKRVSHKQLENVEEEVERLLREDEEWERGQGMTTHNEYSQVEWDRLQNEPEQPYDDDEMDADGEAIDTIEDYDDGYGQTPQEEEADAADLEAQLAGAFEEDAFGETFTETMTNSPAPLTTGAETIMTDAPVVSTPTAETPIAETPAETPRAGTEESEESDEDEDDYSDEDSPDVVDEDAAEKAAERAQQLEEVADLEREIAAVRTKANGMGNMLLRRREMERLGKLEEDLKMKRSAFGLADEDDQGE